MLVYFNLSGNPAEINEPISQGAGIHMKNITQIFVQQCYEANL